MIDNPIRGSVARILNSRELVINRGSANGVRKGMFFSVLDPRTEDIRDPETSEILGSVQRPKTFVKIVTVEDRLSVGRTFRQFNRGGPTLGMSSIAALFEPPKQVVETLKTSESTWEEIDEEESFVKTGDPVVQVDDPTA